MKSTMKNLFKVFGLIALVAIIGFSFAACDDGGGSGPGGSTPGGSTPGGGGGGGGSSALVGKWYATQEQANNPAAYGGDLYAYWFQSDGKLGLSGTNNGVYTYKATSNTITMYAYGMSVGESANYTVSGNVLTITNAGDSGFIDVTLYKGR